MASHLDVTALPNPNGTSNFSISPRRIPSRSCLAKTTIASLLMYQRHAGAAWRDFGTDSLTRFHRRNWVIRRRGARSAEPRVYQLLPPRSILGRNGCDRLSLGDVR